MNRSFETGRRPIVSLADPIQNDNRIEGTLGMATGRAAVILASGTGAAPADGR